MQSSERNFVIWWNCAINVRVVGARYFEGVLFGVKSENNLSRCYLLDKKSRRNPQVPSASISYLDK